MAKKEKIIKEAQEEAAKIKENAEKEIEIQKSAAILAVKELSVELVIDVANKVIPKLLQKKDQEQLIKEAIDELKAKIS